MKEDNITEKKVHLKRYLAFALSLPMTLLTSSVAFASGGSGTDSLEGIKSALTSAFSVTEIASVVASVIGVGVGFVLFWWGARKLVTAIIGAFKSGKLRF